MSENNITDNYFILEVDGLLAKVDWDLMEKYEPFNVEYPGLMLEILEDESGQLNITNAMDGWGNNVKDKYADKKVKCYV